MPVTLVNSEIPRRTITTRAQREIFFIERTHPDTKCSIWFYKRIHGAFDLKILENAIKLCSTSIPLLQTRFVYSDGELWQIRDRNIHHKPRTIDVSTHSTPVQEALRRMRKAVNRSSAMIDDKLCEFTVYIIDNNNYVLHGQFHRAIINTRSWAKVESLITAAYNNLKRGVEIDVQPKLHFDALARADAKYKASDKHEEDEKFWEAYVQPLKRFAYTQRSNNSVGKKTTHQHTMTLNTSERRKFQQVAAAMDIPETHLYVGVSALLLRSLLGREYVSLSLPVRGTYLTHELGMTSNVLPLLLHIPGDATIHEALLRIAQEIKSILKHQRYRIKDILKLANYGSITNFGPYVNIMCYDHGEPLDGCSCSSHFGGITDINEMHITFWTDRPNGRLDILLEDVHEGHSEEQLVALQEHLAFILDLVLCGTNITVATIDEQCGNITTVELCESFYANRRRPVAAGFLQWSRNCDSLVRLVHSNTWVGSGVSPFAISKVLFADRAVSIGKLERVTDSACRKAVGIVLVIEENAWLVTTADGVVRISNFMDEFGQPISAQTLVNQCHIVEGDQLPIITHEQAEWLGKTYAKAMLTEPYWSQRLASFEPCELSFVQSTMTQSPVWATTTYQKSKGASAIEVLTAWFIYIVRDTQMSQLQIGWDATQSWHHVNEVLAKCTFAKTVPFDTCIDLNDTFSNVVTSVKNDYKQLINHLPCLTDILIRHVDSMNNLSGKNTRALAVSLIDTQNVHDDASEHVHGSLMTLEINKHNGAFRWIYDTNQLSEEEVNRISLRLLVLLASAHSADQANVNVAKLNLLPKAEREQLLYSWNQTTVPLSPARCLHQLFEAQVECNGKAIAVECEGETSSYEKLNSQANQLAHYLIARGVKTDDRIALCVERNTKLIIAMLGILKSGCAYVPLDPAYTSQRLTHIVEEADPIFLLVDATGRKTLEDNRVPVIDLDKPLPADLPIDNPDATKLGVTPNHLVYVIYTSGSTGKPKGVMVEHHDAQQLFLSVQDKFNFNNRDQLCLFHSISFDVSVWETWSALLNGGQLSIPSHNTIRSSDKFYDWICDKGITLLSQTPSAFKMLMKAKDISPRSNRLRYVFFGSEASDSLTVREWSEKCAADHIGLVHMYGPTETVVIATSWMCDRTISDNSFTPIGRPLPNKRIYLLDAHGEPVPIGADGEIYIGGAGVARGYLNRPELTAERFLPDPFSDNPTARMYRTGDRARYLPDGNLVYLGRIDQQVKIRGFRIEPGEIEARLVEHPQVHEAVVQSYGNGSDTRLVAYVVADAYASLAQDLRTYLLTLLPEYMVPVAYVCLSSLPLTPNGKVDRRALPPPNDEAFARQQYEAPQGEIEKKLAEIWCELLSIDRISRHDNFFALGGHSLLVVQLLAQLRQIGLDTTVRKVFDAPSLAILVSTLHRYKAVTIAPNLITTYSSKITPEMLPLITLSQAEIDAITTRVPGGVANIQDIYSLTSLQNGMLFHHLMGERGDPYLLISRLSFSDRRKLDRYVSAMQQLIERYDILRTVFIWEGLSEPAQIVLRQVPSLLTEITLHDTSKPVLDQLRLRFNQRRYRLDLTQAPLLRLLAAPTSEGCWVALQLMHHLIGDHTTLEKLQSEIRVIDDRRTEKLTISTTFRQVVAYERLALDPTDHTQYFSEMLANVDEPTLPFGLSDVSLDGTKINEAQLWLRQTLNDQLRAHARKLQVSLASVCHLAWAQVLARASGREAVVFGTVLSGRFQVGEENNIIMGPMINTLPIRIDIDDTSVKTAVRHTHARLSSLLAHEHAPLVLAQRCSGVPAGSSLFSTLFNYRHNKKTEQVNASLPGVTFFGGEGQTNYPLNMSLDDNGRALNLSAHVVSSVSAARICTYMRETLVSLADALAHKPQQPVRILTVIPPEERTLLLQSWNETAVTYPPACCLHQLFEAQVECDGQAIAVEYKGDTLSYAGLNVQANQLANYLITRGVKPDNRVALCVERSTTMIVAMLGILKAGAAYVPLDPVYPSQRLANILLDANPIFIIADAAGRSALGNHQVPVIDLDKPLPVDLPMDNPDAEKLGVTPTNLAYVIYTSGSTGAPKGVMVEHHDAAHLFQSVHDKFDFNAQDKWCLFHSISFDMSVWELWGALLNGSQLSIVPFKLTRSTDEFYDWICTSGITVLTQTPSVFKMLMRAQKICSQFNQLRYVIFGGEALEPSIVKDWYEKYDKIQTVLVNMYGPTETVMIATSWICHITISENSFTPIGRPLPNKRIYLLDAHGELVPLGAEGEMYIGGAAVARGYLNHPKLTAERFLLDPFSDDPAARMYRTGDRARYLPDGNLVYLGRTDQQVKIRGFRIEPGEIEAHLVEHPQVHEAVVQSYGNELDARLVAYVVADTVTSLVQNLRTYLLHLLPEYMVPAAYVCIKSLPLTPNGKLDRRALPPPDDEAFVHQQYEAPQGEMEEKLADIWRQVLGIELVSRYDNFFALGGHSLLVTRLLAQLRAFGLKTTVRKVYNAPSLAMLASTLTRYHAVTIPPNLITTDSTEITPEMLPLITLSQAEIDGIIAQIPGGVANIQDVYCLAPLQHGMLFHHLRSKQGDPYLIVSRMQFDDHTTLERYSYALQKVIERHDILRTALFWEGLSEPVQVVLRKVPSILTEVILDHGEPVLNQLSHRFDLRSYRLDLTKAPLLRLMAAPTSEGCWVALQLMHHSIIDHSSHEVLEAEIHAIIEGNLKKLTTPTPFRHIVAHSRLGVSQAEHTHFFSEMLGDIDEPTLPFGLSDVVLDGNEIDEAILKLSQTLNDQLRAYARKLQVSLASVCHLAWAKVLARASGRDAVVFGTVLLGRSQAGEANDNAVGPMINTLPIRIEIDNTTVETAVRNAHDRMSALLTHEHAQLVMAQRCSRVPAGMPLFSSLLNYRHNQTTVDVPATLPGIRFIEVEERTNYPLTLSVEDNCNSLGLTAQIVSPMSAARICAYMERTLESMADVLTRKPQQSVRALTVIPSEERTLLLHTWNQTMVKYPLKRCLHQLFEAQVQRDGHAIAIECMAEILNYRELNAKANQLAHYLIARGVKPDDRIAVCAQSSIKLVVATLGILKAGGAYVPLDPKYPSQRLTNILQDSNPLYLLVDTVGQAVIGDHRVPTIDLEETFPTDLSIDNPDLTNLGLTPAHLAYIIYTSGSTGTPKGVMVEHRNVTNCLHWINENFTAEDFKHTSFSTSANFDMSLYECFAPLSMGATLHIIPDVLALSPSSNISMLSTVPSAVTTILNAGSLPLSLCALHLAGEPLKSSLIKRIFTLTQVTQLCNLYGQTETSFFSTLHRFKRGDEAIETIGRPIANTQIYLLDSYGEPVPLGAEGEMYIGGAPVARGYLNHPELTAERFLLDSFSDNPQARMFRTGDRARYLPDGKLLYLGRTDQQVKIRGFRIEPGEIEAHLVDHPQVHEAVVQSYGNGSDALLVAYVVANAYTSLAQDLRTYLSTLLPEYMVPVAYVCLQSLPFTPNGKLDRRALPPPDDEAFVRQQYEAPRGEMEEKLAEIWCELLSIERISRHDNFFALGGHSLSVVQLLGRLRQNGLDTSVQEVFDAPTLAMLSAMLVRYQLVTIPPNLITPDSTEITPEMLPLITLSQVEINAIVAHVPGGTTNIQDIYGLTPLQHGMLFHHLRAEEGDPYLIAMRMQFTDRTALDRYMFALQQVIERYDILRTVFIWEGLSDPAQVVLRHVPSLLKEIILDHTGEPVLDQLSHRFDPRYYRLDLTQAPLLRLHVSPSSEGIWVALQLMHHLIIDHSTLERLQAEIHAIIDGKIEMLTTAPSFRHIVAHARLGVSSAEHMRFFTEILSDIDEPTLPFGLTDVALNGTEINESHVKLSQALNDQLRAHARKLQVSLASICHLAWAQVLARASGRQAVVFGTVLLGRLHARKENNNIMGPMINTLPIRIDIDDTSVETTVRNTHSRLSSLLAHEHAPLALAQRCSGIPVGVPLFNALLNYRHSQKADQVTTTLPGIRVKEVEERTNYPLALTVEDFDVSLSLIAQVISPMSAAQICAYMQQALESMAKALNNTTQQPVRTLAVVPSEECTMLLHTWNQTTVTYSSACCLHQLFEAQVERDGQAIAVESNGKTISYAELNIKSNQLAHYMIEQGIKPDDRIALCIERGITMIVAILGILKAGAAYVPLDPAYPSQRLTNILLDVDPIFLIADAMGRKALGEYKVPVIELDIPLPDGLSINNLDAIKLGLTPTNLAYVIYTSGSTGTPKGVMVEHQHAEKLVKSLHAKFEFDSQDKWSLFHSFSFDFSVWEIFGALLNRNQLSIVPHDTTRSADEFYDWICTRGITVLNQTTTAFKMLMRAKNISSQSDQLRYVFFGGEASDSLIVRDWYEKCTKNQTVLAHVYGPTETVVFATSWICDNTISKRSMIPIGRPLSNKRIYLLDAHGDPVPLGAEGEMYIGGTGAARGYLNRPELTAEHFLPDPFSDDPTARMYRTGDRARYLPDGNLIYLGRTDQQVKIRGFRIELGEIEVHLVKHPHVREAIVQSYGNGSDARLVAYVVADADTSLAQDLRTYLSELLPEYMVPVAYVCLQSLPFTSNGKLDRRALPPPDDEAFAHQEYEAPQGEIEENLANIWRELLGVERMSRHDNFFALGGHSLLVVRLLAELRQIGLDTTVREVFDSSTLAVLSSTLDRYQEVTVPTNFIIADSTVITPEMLPLITLSQTEIDAIVALVPDGVANIQDIYGLAPLQNGILFHNMMAKQRDPYLTVMRMHFSDRTALDRYVFALQQVIERHDILRTVFIWEGLREPAQVVLRQVPSLLSEVSLDDTGEPVLDQLSHRFDSRNYRFELTQAPLLRLFAAPTFEGSWVALQLMHHLIIDHSTFEQLQEELHAIIDGRIEKLPMPTSFRHIVAQVRLGISQDEHTRFFSEMLSDIDEPSLPFGLCDVSLDGTEINETHLKLSQTLNDELRALAGSLQVSLASICHLAWAQVLARASGREAVVFGTVLVGRLQAGGGNDNAMGPMINTLPIRIDIDERSVKIAVRNAHARLSALLAHEYAPLALAQRCSGCPAGLPLFSALLNYRHNKETEQITAPLCGVSVINVEERTNYPLALSVEDGGDSLGLTAQIVPTMSAARICAYMEEALISLPNALIHSPQKPIRRLKVMPPEERKMLLHSWNQTTVTYPPARCLHQLFEALVEHDGQAIAVEYKGETLSYAGLNVQANQLANYLIARGVKSDNRVALCVERSTTMIVAMLGILKSGAAYVPLDPAYSSQRLT
ncbi:uncharacterized protein LOC129568840, partial [Sitodiplosis mosellana]|uniref:uncharacterized protein LOC129568840 n=1 Tax=Sitodiplosis mosellana TaxID=263140 RepID=UPI002443E032